MKRLSMFLLVLLMMGSVSVVSAEDLFPSSGFQSLVADKKANKVDDQVTILIIETSQAKASADANGKQNLNLSVGVSTTNRSDNAGLQAGIGRTSAADTQREGELKARITATVEKIDESGRLFVSGKQRIQVNGEDQVIAVSGWLRPQDITSQDTALSTRLSDADIRYEGKGAVGDPTHRGFIYWLFSKIGLI